MVHRVDIVNVVNISRTMPFPVGKLRLHWTERASDSMEISLLLPFIVIAFTISFALRLKSFHQAFEPLLIGLIEASLF